MNLGTFSWLPDFNFKDSHGSKVTLNVIFPLKGPIHIGAYCSLKGVYEYIYIYIYINKTLGPLQPLHHVTFEPLEPSQLKSGRAPASRKHRSPSIFGGSRRTAPPGYIILGAGAPRPPVYSGGLSPGMLPRLTKAVEGSQKLSKTTTFDAEAGSQLCRRWDKVTRHYLYIYGALIYGLYKQGLR